MSPVFGSIQLEERIASPGVRIGKAKQREEN